MDWKGSWISIEVIIHDYVLRVWFQGYGASEWRDVGKRLKTEGQSRTSLYSLSIQEGGSVKVLGDWKLKNPGVQLITTELTGQGSVKTGHRVKGLWGRCGRPRGGPGPLALHLTPHGRAPVVMSGCARLNLKRIS